MTVVLNHTTSPLTASVTAELYDLNGVRLGAQNQAITVASSNKAEGVKVAFGADLPALHLFRLKLTDAAARFCRRTPTGATANLPTSSA